MVAKMLAGVAAGALGAVTGGVLGNALDRVFGEVLEEVRGRTAGHGTIPLNHNLERAIRLAQLSASLFVLRDWQRDQEYTWANRDDASEPHFLKAALARLHDQLGVCWRLSMQPDDALARDLATAMDAGLADPVGPAEAALRLRTEAEQAAFQDLLDGLPGLRVPDAFHDRFMGARQGVVGWHAAFILFIREIFQNQPRAQTALVVRDLSTLLREHATLRRVLDGLDTSVATLLGETRAIREEQKTGFEETKAAVSAVAQDVAGLGAKFDMTIAGLQRAVDTYMAGGGAGAAQIRAIRAALPASFAAYPDEALPVAVKTFVERAEAIEAELAKRTNFPAEVEAARQRAKALVEALRIEDAEAELAKARALLRESREQTAREEARLLGEEADLARLRIAYREAAAKLDEAADLVRFDTEAAWGYARRAADVVTDLGSEFGDNDVLRDAVARYRRCLGMAPRDRVPLDWAATQNNLGNALLRLGERGDEAALRDAVVAYRLALEEYRRDRVPLDWAMTQNNLGTALATLGERGDGAALRDAVVAYRLALEEYRRDRVPLDWAMTQNNLGTALATLGERGDGAALRDAVVAYRLALEEYRRDRVPLNWAATQNNLGIALQTLGARGDDAALRDAVVAFCLALEERRRDRVPLDWATTQNNLGNALRVMGERGDDAALRDAVIAYRAALEVVEAMNAPAHVAMFRKNLSLAEGMLRYRGL